MNCGCENTREIFPNCDMSRWEVQCSSYIEDADNYYTKPQIDEMLEEIESAITSGCCITPEEVDEKIDEAVSGKQDTLSAGTNIIISGNVISSSGCDLTNYYTTAQTDSKISEAVSGKQDTLIEGRAIDITNNTVSLDLPISADTGVYSIAEGRWTAASGGYSHAEGFSSSALGDYSHAEGYQTLARGSYSHTEGYKTEAKNDYEHVSGQFNNSVSATTTFGDSGNTLFSVGNGDDFHKHNTLEIRQNGDIYIADTSVSGEYYQKPMIKLQDALGGGSGVTSGEVQSMIDNATSGLQQTLTAGTNVQINNNIISATDTTYTAGDNITISNQNVISTITKFWCGTQAQYDQITTKDPNTVYMIHS